MAVAGPVLVTDRSALTVTGIATVVEVLFAGFGSVTVPVAVAVLTIDAVCPAAMATVSVTGVLAPEFSEATVHVTLCPAAVQPVPETKVSPAGSVSVTVTVPEALGPLLRTVSV